VSNIKEVQARNGTIVAITTDVSGLVEKVADYTVKLAPTRFDFLNALLSIIPMQLLAYHVARLRGCDIDQPRNLAKSVTVE
jgi:glucosamine--fructose-6-phosphate aminotransferase (isomerizing)